MALDGWPAASFAKRLVLPVSNDTLLRVVRSRRASRADPLTVVGVDDWAFPADGHNWPAMLVERPSMDIAYVSNERKISAFAAAALLLSSLSLGGCATSTAGSSLMDARGEAPAHPKTTGYLAVEDVPPRPEKPAMTADEQLKLKKELSATRDRQASDGKAKGGAARAKPTKPTKPTTLAQ
jgi:hypothetical protein